MKKQGFTLIELLAVIVILGVLAVIVVPKVVGDIEETRTATYSKLMSEIEQLTQLYVRDNKDDIPGITTAGNTVTITLQNLVDSEGLKTPIIDPRSDRTISLTTSISILVKPRNKYTVTIGTLIYNE